MHEKEEFEKDIIDSHKALKNYAIFLTKDQELACDLLQETLLRILTKIDKYDEHGCFEAWAKKVMKNIFINEKNNNEKHKQTFVDGYSYINDDSLHPSVSENDNKYSKEDINKAIDMLPARYAQMITMQMAGYKYEEIAQRMNISVGCVKSTLFAAKNRLKKILNN